MFDLTRFVERFVTVGLVGLVILVVSWALAWELPALVGIYLVTVSGFLFLCHSPGGRQRLTWFQAQSLPKRAVLAALTVVILWFLGSWMAGEVYDRDCDNFPSHGAAELFYHVAGGPVLDFHELDDDGDGNACESEGSQRRQRPQRRQRR